MSKLKQAFKQGFQKEAVSYVDDLLEITGGRVFHGTSPQHLDDILKRGLNPSKSVDNRSWLTSNPYMALRHGRSGGSAGILEVRPNSAGIQKKDVLPTNPQIFTTKNQVPPGAISKVPPGRADELSDISEEILKKYSPVENPQVNIEPSDLI